MCCRYRLLPGAPVCLLHACQGDVARTVRTHTRPSVRQAAARQRAFAALLLSEHRQVRTRDPIALVIELHVTTVCCSLESEAGIDDDKVVAAHGNFDSATCIATGQKVPIQEVTFAMQRSTARH